MIFTNAYANAAANAALKIWSYKEQVYSFPAVPDEE
jgi:hypothetical protein